MTRTPEEIQADLDVTIKPRDGMQEDFNRAIAMAATSDDASAHVWAFGMRAVVSPGSHVHVANLLLKEMSGLCDDVLDASRGDSTLWTTLKSFTDELLAVNQRILDLHDELDGVTHVTH